MPSCDPKLAERIIRTFGNKEPHGPMKYLLKRGFSFTGGGDIELKEKRPIDAGEWDAINFLVLEWDYSFKGTFLTSPSSPSPGS